MINVILTIIFHPLVFFGLLMGVSFVIRTFKLGLRAQKTLKEE